VTRGFLPALSAGSEAARRLSLRLTGSRLAAGLRTALRLAPLTACGAWLSGATVMVADDDVRLDLGILEQARAERADATAADGTEWDVVRARPGNSDDIDWSLRRARLGVAGTYDQDYRFNLTLDADLIDLQGYQETQNVGIYYAWLARDFSSGEATQTINAGLNDAFFNRADSAAPYFLFPSERASAALMTVRGIGVGYHLATPDADFGIDLRQSLDPNKPVENASNADGFFYSVRLEFSPLDGAKPAYQESYAGAPGEGILLTGDYGVDDRDQSLPGYTIRKEGYGFEGLGHLDGLSVLLEARYLNLDQASNGGGAGPSSENHQRVLIVQAGYATQLGQMVFEECGRWSEITFDAPAGSPPPNYNGGTYNPQPDSDWGDSGKQYDLGINLYLKGHANKLQLAYSRWTASSGAARAGIWRLQQQLFF